jgi:hypothetical protein
MRINEIINEGTGVDMNMSPELLQQELDRIVELIKKGGYIMTPEDMYVFQQAKENKVFHSDEIDFKTHNRKLGAELNPELSRLREVLKQSGDISHLVDYNMSNKHKELLTQQVRTDTEVRRIYDYVRLSLLKNACNGTWRLGACYLDNHKWILDMVKEKANAKSLANYEKMKQDPEWVEKANAKSLAYQEKYRQDPEYVAKINAQQRADYEKHKQDPEWVEKHNARSLAYQEKYRQDPEWVKKGKAQRRADYEKHKQDPEWVEKKNAQQRAYLEKMRQDPEWVEKKKAQQRAYLEKMRQDPEWVEKNNARARADYNKNKST